MTVLCRRDEGSWRREALIRSFNAENETQNEKMKQYTVCCVVLSLHVHDLNWMWSRLRSNRGVSENAHKMKTGLYLQHQFFSFIVLTHCSLIQHFLSNKKWCVIIAEQRRMRQAAAEMLAPLQSAVEEKGISPLRKLQNGQKIKTVWVWAFLKENGTAFDCRWQLKETTG